MDKKPVKDYFKQKPVPPPPLPVRFVVPKGERTGTLKALTEIRKLFGPKGENWIRGYEHKTKQRKGAKGLMQSVDTFCLVGGIKHVNGEHENAARAAIALAIIEATKQRADLRYKDADSVIIHFNDNTKTGGWKTIKKVLTRARQLINTAAAK